MTVTTLCETKWAGRRFNVPGPGHHLVRGSDMSKPITHGTTGYRRGCRCDECREAAVGAGRQWRAANPERKRLASAAWYQRNKDRLSRESAAEYWADPERFRAKALEWYQANRDQALEANKAWREANLERNRARNRQGAKAWSAANPQRKKQNGYKYRAARYAADALIVTERDWRRLCARYGHSCAYCGEHRTLTQDHVIPIVRGGRHAIGNLLPACRSCNSSKRTRLLIEWSGRPR